MQRAIHDTPCRADVYSRDDTEVENATKCVERRRERCLDLLRALRGHHRSAPAVEERRHERQHTLGRILHHVVAHVLPRVQRGYLLHRLEA